MLTSTRQREDEAMSTISHSTPQPCRPSTEHCSSRMAWAPASIPTEICTREALAREKRAERVRCAT